MSEPVLVAEGLGKSFERPALVTALRGVTFALAPGELVALAGPSGSGKSTLLSLAGGLLTPTAGRIAVAGVEPASLPPTGRARQRNAVMGFVYQFHHLLPELTALENVALPALIALREGWRTGTQAAVLARARDLLASVGLAERAAHRPGQLSGGEAQRAAVARALMNEPALILADEPTGNLDRASSIALMDLLAGVIRGGRTALLIATHNAELVARADRVLQLSGGELVS